MGVFVTILCVSLIISTVGCKSAGEFNILHSPNSLKFFGTTRTLESLLKEIVSACLGLSINENTQWTGLYVNNPFSTPEAVVGVHIDGVPNFTNTALKSFPMAVDEYEPDIFETVKRRIRQKYVSGANILMDIKLYDPKELASQHFEKVFGGFTGQSISKQHSTLAHLKHNVEVDSLFLKELEALKFITMQVQSGAILPDNLVDFYNFHFRSFHALCDFHGPNSAQAKEASELLDAAVQELCKAFVKAYKGSVLVTTIIIDGAHSRRAIRSPQETSGSDTDESPAPPPPEEDTETPIEDKDPGGGSNASDFDPDFPVIFNIMLWTGVAYFFILVAIVYAMMDMDPGRDSIIYKMSNIKVKKEN